MTSPARAGVRRLAILGSTGSIGCSALSVVDRHPDRLEVVAIAAGRNSRRLIEQVTRYRPSLVGVGSDDVRAEVKSGLPAGVTPEIVPGNAGLVAAAIHPDVDLVLCASSGTAALEAALAAIEAGKTIALANKEVLVTAGRLMMDAARRHGVAILPVDSEHNAIHQCLDGRPPGHLRRLVLTASGGPFRDWPRERLAMATPEDALKHPTWRMGRKITVDSATLMNKGLEVIEAHWLFGVEAGAIDVVLHPQSVVHSMVELCDGSVIAQLGVTDMRLPIQYAFSYPERWEAMLPSLDLAHLGTLEFLEPDTSRFPALRLAFQALERGGSRPIVLNAANEVAVAAFLDGRLAFTGIPALIEHALEAADLAAPDPASLADVLAVDRWAREFSTEAAGTLRFHQ